MSILARINPLVVLCAIAATLAVAYGVLGYLDYFMPGDSGCFDDSACISQIEAERRLDFMATHIAMLFVFVISFGLLVLGLAVFVAIRDRWSFGE
jgi:hypothetical protein